MNRYGVTADCPLELLAEHVSHKRPPLVHSIFDYAFSRKMEFDR